MLVVALEFYPRVSCTDHPPKVTEFLVVFATPSGDLNLKFI